MTAPRVLVPCEQLFREIMDRYGDQVAECFVHNLLNGKLRVDIKPRVVDPYRNVMLLADNIQQWLTGRVSAAVGVEVATHL